MSRNIMSIVVFGLVNKAAAQYLYADGGYQEELSPCVFQWTYKEKLKTGENIETQLTGCVSIEDFKPFPFYGEGDAAEIENLIEPSEPDTDKAKWCPVLREVYNPTPIRNEGNKFNWGYCYDERTDVPTSSPVSPPPTFPPVDDDYNDDLEPTGTPVTPPEPTSKPVLPPTVPEPTLKPVLPPTAQKPSGNDSGADAGTNVFELGIGSWTGIGIGVALIVVAVVLAVVLLGRRTRKENEVEDEIVEDHHDIEELRMERS